MARISVKIENALVDEIEEDRKNKGLKLSNWVTNAVQSYLHPPAAGTDHTGEIEELKRVSDELFTSRAERENLATRWADLERRHESLKAERDRLVAELTYQKNQLDTMNTRQELSVTNLAGLEKRCDTLRDEKESIRAELTELKSRYNVLKGEKENLGIELAQFNSRYDSLKGERETLMAELSRLKSTCDRICGERDQAVADRNRFLAERENLEKQMREMAVEAERSKAKTIMIDELRKDKDFYRLNTASSVIISSLNYPLAVRHSGAGSGTIREPAGSPAAFQIPARTDLIWKWHSPSRSLHPDMPAPHTKSLSD